MGPVRFDGAECDEEKRGGMVSDIECAHGQLKRSCEICERDKRIESLEQQLAAAKADAVRLRAYAARAQCEEDFDNPEYPWTKQQLRQGMRRTTDALRAIAIDRTTEGEG